MMTVLTKCVMAGMRGDWMDLMSFMEIPSVEVDDEELSFLIASRDL